MTLAGQLLAASAGQFVVAACAGVLLPRQVRSATVGAITAAASASALAAALVVLAGGAEPATRLASLLPFWGSSFRLDPLGSLFVAAAALVALPSSIFMIGACREHLDGRTVQAAWPLFVLTLILVPTAAGVTTFLTVWELMALSSLVLVLADHQHRPEVSQAGAWYAAMTHAGFISILVGLIWFASSAGADGFPALRAAAAGMTGGARCGVFLLVLAGFASKAGIVPLHVWLPRAHTEAPSHASALMSGAMVNLGIYGILRVGWDLLGGGPRWWGILVLGLGLLSVLYGVLHALMTSDIKRLLAYSTTENMGLVLVGIGAGGMYAAGGRPALAAVAFAAAALHVLNHSVFKGVLFLSAGAAVHATGTRDLDRMGGLAARMPWTAASFAVGALAIAALPPLNGFASEWLLLQSLAHGLPSGSLVVAVALPLSVAIVALAGGLAATTFVKAFGTGFLAMPRSTGAASAAERPASAIAGMLALAGTCVGLGILPSLLAGPLGRAVHMLRISRGAVPTGSGLRLGMDALRGFVWLVPLAVAMGIAALVVLAARRLAGGARARPAEGWGCGRAVRTARAEYTATSFAEPVQRVFDDVLRPDLGVDVSHAAESRFFIEAVRYRRGIPDLVDTRCYRPILAGVRRWGQWARGLQNGSIHRSLAFALAGLIAVLLVAR